MTQLKKLKERRAAFWNPCSIAAIFLAVFALQFGHRPAMAFDGHAGLNSVPLAQTESTTAENPRGFLEIVFAGGWTGFLIVLLLLILSIAALGVGLEQLFALRRDSLIPPDLSDKVHKALSQGNLSAAEQAVASEPSVLAFVLRTALAEVAGGWNAVEKAGEDALAEQSARLLRKIEYLSVIGNIGPMIGLLGTVIGMIFAFQEVADTQGAARAAELASGIYQALVTTVGGLLVAIPSLAAFAVLRNRIDQLIAEVAYNAQHALRPLKRAKLRRSEPNS